MGNIFYAVKLDVNAKQNYIFSSNRMKEVLGASKIIEFVTEILGHVIIDKMIEEKYAVNHNKFTDIMKRKNDDGDFEEYRGTIHTEAGGNAMYFFESEDIAKAFIKKFSLYVLTHFEGLSIAMVMEEFDIETDLAFILYQKLENKISKLKNNPIKYSGKVNHGMYDRCPNSGNEIGYEIFEIKDEFLNANEVSDSKKEFVSKLVSKESYDKRLFYEIVVKNESISTKIYSESQKYFLTSKFNLIDEDPFGLNKYETQPDSIVNRKLKWMKSYYTISDSENISKVFSNLGKHSYENKTIFTKNEIEDMFLNEKDNLGESVYEKRLSAIDKLGDIKENKSSMIGLSALDGNGMGDKIRRIPKEFLDLFILNFENAVKQDSKDLSYLQKINSNNINISEDDKNGLSDYGKGIITENNILFLKFFEIFTEEVQKTYESAFIKMLSNKKTQVNKASNDKQIEIEKLCNPIVPIIIAGDDISFWSSGYDCIQATTCFLKNVSVINDEQKLSNRIIKELERSESIPIKLRKDGSQLIKEYVTDNFDNITVSGGIAITKISYPVSKAYKIVEVLESNAKKKTKEKEVDNNYPAILDWELVRGEEGNLKHRREERSIRIFENTREFGLSFINRPYEVFSKYSAEENQMDEFIEVINDIIKIMKEKDKSTQLKSLFRKMEKNPAEALLFANSKNIDISKTEMLLDAIEIIGLYE